MKNKIYRLYLLHDDEWIQEEELQLKLLRVQLDFNYDPDKFRIICNEIKTYVEGDYQEIRKKNHKEAKVRRSKVERVRDVQFCDRQKQIHEYNSKRSYALNWVSKVECRKYHLIKNRKQKVVYPFNDIHCYTVVDGHVNERDLNHFLREFNFRVQIDCTDYLKYKVQNIRIREVTNEE